MVDPAGSLSIDEAAAPQPTVSRQPVGLDALAYEYPYYLVALDERRLDCPSGRGSRG